MATIYKSFEKTTRNGFHYEVRVSAKVNNREDVLNLSPDEFSADLFINGAYVADISPVLFKMDSLMEEIDQTDWDEIYHDQVVDAYEDYHGED